MRSGRDAQRGGAVSRAGGAAVGGPRLGCTAQCISSSAARLRLLAGSHSELAPQLCPTAPLLSLTPLPLPHSPHHQVCLWQLRRQLL